MADLKRWAKKMKHLAAIIILLTLVVTGCEKKAPPLSREEVLRQLLGPEFVRTSFPKEKEAEFYPVLEAFAAGRSPYDLVRKIDFRSDSEVHISFSDIGIHGGGTATAKKTDGHWVVVQTLRTL